MRKNLKETKAQGRDAKQKDMIKKEWKDERQEINKDIREKETCKKRKYKIRQRSKKEIEKSKRLLRRHIWWIQKPGKQQQATIETRDSRKGLIRKRKQSTRRRRQEDEKKRTRRKKH